MIPGKLTEDRLSEILKNMQRYAARDGQLSEFVAGCAEHIDPTFIDCVSALAELQEHRRAHTNFTMPSRISNIELRSPLEVEDTYRAMLRTMFTHAGLRLHEQPEEDPDLPPAFTCSECGFETSDPEGRHYCCEDNSDE